MSYIALSCSSPTHIDLLRLNESTDAFDRVLCSTTIDLDSRTVHDEDTGESCSIDTWKRALARESNSPNVSRFLVRLTQYCRLSPGNSMLIREFDRAVQADEQHAQLRTVHVMLGGVC